MKDNVTDALDIATRLLPRMVEFLLDRLNSGESTENVAELAERMVDQIRDNRAAVDDLIDERFPDED